MERSAGPKFFGLSIVSGRMAKNFAWLFVLAVVLSTSLAHLVERQGIEAVLYAKGGPTGKFFENRALQDEYALTSSALASSPDLFYLKAGLSTTDSAQFAQTQNGVGGASPEPTLPSVGGIAVIASSSPLTTASSLNSRQSIVNYTVKEGDNPTYIAAAFGVTTNTILWANNLSDGEVIRPGEDLKIPPVSGVVHKVKKGDTLGSLAKRYNGEAAAIIAFNDLPQGGTVFAGQTIVIPDGEMPRRTFANTYASSYSGRDLGGYFIKPVAGRISQGLHATNAIDIAASCWSPVFAAADGKISISDGYGWNGGYGKYVRVRHDNGVDTVYSHLIKTAVSPSQRVSQGDVIGYIGSTGRSTGCHLHWEVWGARNPLAA